MGNALLDMLVTSGEELLQKYGLKENDAILVEESIAPCKFMQHSESSFG
jgi:hypothetical protein